MKVTYPVVVQSDISPNVESDYDSESDHVLDGKYKENLKNTQTTVQFQLLTLVSTLGSPSSTTTHDATNNVSLSLYYNEFYKKNTKRYWIKLLSSQNTTEEFQT